MNDKHGDVPRHDSRLERPGGSAADNDGSKQVVPECFPGGQVGAATQCGVEDSCLLLTHFCLKVGEVIAPGGKIRTRKHGANRSERTAQHKI